MGRIVVRAVSCILSLRGGDVFGLLGHNRLRLPNSRSSRRNDPRHEYRLENLPTSTCPALLPARVQVHSLSQRRAVSNKVRAVNCLRKQKRRLRKVSASNMPTGQLNVGQKVWATFPYPSSGRVRIQVEADGPVDVFVSTPEVSAQIGSVPDAARFVPNVLIYNLQRSLNQLIDIPPTWRVSGWTLTIGHPGHGVRPGVIAVHYEVYPV